MLAGERLRERSQSASEVAFTPGIEGYKVAGSFHVQASSPVELGPIPVATDRLRVVVDGKASEIALSLCPGEATHARLEKGQ